MALLFLGLYLDEGLVIDEALFYIVELVQSEADLEVLVDVGEEEVVGELVLVEVEDAVPEDLFVVVSKNC